MRNPAPSMTRRARPIRLAGLLVASLLLCMRVAVAASPAIAFPTGSGSFVFDDARGDPGKHLTVYTYLPKGLDAATARIVFVMHGHGKDADTYRDAWIEQADRYRFMVVAPLFDPDQWGGGAYSYASVVGGDGSLRDPSLWSFSAIEHLFDAIEQATGNTTPSYYLYGHSEGAQFVHRLMLLLPDARVARAVAANAGWYTMPTAEVPFPFGIAGSPIDEATLRRSYGHELVVLLGDRDIDPNHRELNKTPRAEAQGINRFERGNNFFRQSEARAHDLDTPFAWRLRIVRGAAHQNSRMSPPAAAVLMAP
jgi:hypothetical protein